MVTLIKYGVVSVSNTDGTLTISPTTGAVIASINLSNANTWVGQQTFSTSSPIFSTMTQGSVLFAGASGILSQNNSLFFWDNSNIRLSINGTDTMTVNGTLTASHFSVHGADGLTEVEIEMHRHGDTAGAGASIYGARSRGTSASPTIVQSGDVLLNYTGLGYDGVDYAASAQIQLEVDGTPGSNDMPGRIVFSTTPDGSQALVERMRISSTGRVSIFGMLATAGINQTVAIKSANYTLTTSDEVVVFTATATATLPAASGTGQTFRIICRSGTLTIDGNGTDTVVGSLTQTLTAGENLIITDTATGIWE